MYVVCLLLTSSFHRFSTAVSVCAIIVSVFLSLSFLFCDFLLCVFIWMFLFFSFLLLWQYIFISVMCGGVRALNGKRSQSAWMWYAVCCTFRSQLYTKRTTVLERAQREYLPICNCLALTYHSSINLPIVHFYILMDVNRFFFDLLNSQRSETYRSSKLRETLSISICIYETVICSMNMVCC